jgi:CTP synthase
VFYVHVTLVPFIGPAGEQKTKPTQHSVTELRSRGIQPDVLVCRSDRAIGEDLKAKISRLCDVEEAGIVAAPDADSIYEIPLVLHNEGLDEYVCQALKIEGTHADISEWKTLVKRVQSAQQTVRIGLVGKYVELADAYLSVAEALRHAGYALDSEVEIDWISSENTEGLLAEQALADVDALIVPGGFGLRGIEGKVNAITHARENGLPFLGLCLGLQCAVVEYARNVAGMPGADSAEFDPDSPYPVIDIMDDQRGVEDLGGTMRLGSYPARLEPGSIVADLYGEPVVYERHRHRYEVSNKFRDRLVESGLVIAGTSPDRKLVEFIELPVHQHPFFVATQAHPEFQSRPDRPHPLFFGLIRAALARANAK